MVVHSSLQCDMLADANGHILRRGHVDHRRLAGIGIGNPYGDGKLVDGAAEGHRDSTCEVEEEGREAGLERYKESMSQFKDI